MLEVEIDVLDKNNRTAARNRARFAAKQQLVLNLVSSPGSGKTTLLTETLTRLKGRADCAVIEGDQQRSMTPPAFAPPAPRRFRSIPGKAAISTPR